ncbi:MAG: hypothetical protein KJZ65_12655 [Phycisphaerales bacterium]|nr:hypothetical protein [Phycisphaerales bacterium]
MLHGPVEPVRERSTVKEVPPTRLPSHLTVICPAVSSVATSAVGVAGGPRGVGAAGGGTLAAA